MIEICDNCGLEFDSDNAGHYDEPTGLFFCWADCEQNYDRTIGLPDKYILPQSTQEE